MGLLMQGQERVDARPVVVGVAVIVRLPVAKLPVGAQLLERGVVDQELAIRLGEGDRQTLAGVGREQRLVSLPALGQQAVHVAGFEVADVTGLDEGRQDLGR